MPTYIALVNWTDQGIRNVGETANRLHRGAEEADEYGASLKHAYWTVGPYDMISIIEAPDDESVSAYLLEICSEGNLRTTTLRAYDGEEMRGILERLG